MEDTFTGSPEMLLPGRAEEVVSVQAVRLDRVELFELVVPDGDCMDSSSRFGTLLR
jgi:hypothetical protein